MKQSVSSGNLYAFEEVFETIIVFNEINYRSEDAWKYPGLLKRANCFDALASKLQRQKQMRNESYFVHSRENSSRTFMHFFFLKRDRAIMLLKSNPHAPGNVKLEHQTTVLSRIHE
jgi:hypothetical protein